MEVGLFAVDENNEPITWNGVTIVNGNGFNIKINAYNLSNSSDHQRQGTITHEIGHLLWFDDYTSGSPPNDYSIMDYQRDRELIYTPQLMDVYHVNTKY